MESGKGWYRICFLVDLQTKLCQTPFQEVYSWFVIYSQGIDEFWEILSFGVAIKVDSSKS